MAVIDGRTWLEIMPSPECWGLLRSAHVGRLAFVLDGRPEVFPVNFVVDDDTVVFRTDAGVKLDAVTRGGAVAFEVDHADLDEHTGWSVVVKGWTEQIQDPETLRRMRGLPLQPWSYGEKSYWVRLRPDVVTGRRIVRVAPGLEPSR